MMQDCDLCCDDANDYSDGVKDDSSRGSDHVSEL